MRVVVIQHKNSGMKKQMPEDEWEQFQFTESGKSYRKTSTNIELYQNKDVKFIPPEAGIKEYKLPKGATVKAEKDTNKPKTKK